MKDHRDIMKRDHIIMEIDVAFNGVSLREGIGYYEAHALDDYADSRTIIRARERDRQSKRWQDLSVDSIQNLLTAFSFTDRHGFYFLFPVFMVLCIKQGNGDELVTTLESMRKKQDPRIDGFSVKQKRTIARSLQFLSEAEALQLPDYVQHHDAKIALKEYWGQFLT